MSENRTTWRFPRAFWTANAVELCERAAYYGTFIALRTYLLRVVGLDDVQAGFVAGLFGALIYLFPFFTGAAADRLGFRASLLLAFALLAVGYGSLGVVHTMGPVSLGLLLIVLGGAFVKPVITGTASKSSDETNRARAFSIFYMMVNIGSFTGKTIVAPIRIEMGVARVPFFSAIAALVAFLVVGFIFVGYMLKRFCPDPASLPAALQQQHALWLAGQAAKPEAYAQAHYLWYAFAGVGVASLIGMLVFMAVTRRIDARRAAIA